MKTALPLALVLLFATPLASAAEHADSHAMHHDTEASAKKVPLSQGTVKKLDKAKGLVTIAHGPLTNLDMPAMTMSFKLKDPTWLDQLKPGDKISFLAEEIGGALTVTRLERK